MQVIMTKDREKAPAKPVHTDAAMKLNWEVPMEGGCACGAVTYRFDFPLMIVHCCHCRWCQRETGSAFVINALIETSKLAVTGAVETIVTPSQSGKGQIVIRCPRCKIALWSHYAGGGPKVAFVRVGTMGDPAACPPDVHIFTGSKLPWIKLPKDAKAFPRFYPDPSQVWTVAARARYTAAKASG